MSFSFLRTISSIGFDILRNLKYGHIVDIWT